MIERLTGKVVALRAQQVCLQVGGIGFSLLLPARSVQELVLGSRSTVFVSLFLKDQEERIVLYGFLKEREKALFELLISTQGVGPKAGLSILDACTEEQIIRAIERQEPHILEKANGVGKKLAQRIVFELEAPLKKLLSGAWFDFPLPTKASASPSTVYHDVQSALENMGYHPNEIKKALQQSFDEQITFQENIKNCLKYLKN